MIYQGMPRHVRCLHAAPGPMSHDIEHWAETFASMDIAALKLVDDGGGDCFGFALEAGKRGMTAVVRLYRQYPNPGTLPAKAIDTARRYVAEGFRFMEPNNEPNLPWEWPPEQFPESIEENARRVIPNWIADATALINIGAYPAFPALAQCGFHAECSSIRWYTEAFRFLAEKHYDVAKKVFSNGAWIASHDAALNHFFVDDGGKFRFDYPYDPNCQLRHPGRVIADDDNSLIGHQLPVRLLWQYFKRVVPVMSTEGGIFYSTAPNWNGQWDTHYPPIDSQWRHALSNVKMFEWLAAYAARYPWYRGMFPWHACDVVCGCPKSIWSEEAWFQPGQEFEIVGELKRYKQMTSAVPLPEEQGGKILYLSSRQPGTGEESTPPTPAPTPTPTPTPEPEPEVPVSIDYDGLTKEMIGKLVIAGPAEPSKPHWKIKRIEIQPDCDKQSIYAILPPGTDFQMQMYWADGEAPWASPKADPYEPEGAREWAASYPVFRGGWGTYGMRLNVNAESLWGVGLYEKQGDQIIISMTGHHPTLVYFQLSEGGGPEPQPTPEPEPQPEPQPEPTPTPVPDGFYAKFPRPPRDNGMGIHLGLGDRLVGAALDEDIARLKAMRIRWATVAFGAGEDVMLEAAKKLYAAGIMPIVRKVLTIDGKYDFARDARLLLSNGVPAYIQIFNEPSDKREWKKERPADYMQRWASLWAQKAGEVAGAGGFPGVQCLNPPELFALFSVLPKTDYVWEYAWFCSHNYGLNHPPAWKGDYWSVLGWETFAGMFQDFLGFVPPIICGEGGWLWKASDDNNFPPVLDDLHASYHKEMYEWFRTGKLSDGGSLPDYLFAVCPWILSGSSDEAWYGFTERTATISAVKSIPEFVRAASMPDVPPEPEVPEEPEEEEPTPMPEIPYLLEKRLGMAPYGFEDLRAEIRKISDVKALDATARRDAQGNPLFHLIEFIVVHNSGYDKPHTPMSMAQQAVKEGEPTIEYHFCIQNGKLFWTAPLVWVTNHTYQFNSRSIGICVLGKYDNKDPDSKDLETLRFFITAFEEFMGQGWGRSRPIGLVPHRYVVKNATACPGRIWPAVLRGLRPKLE